MENHKIVIRSLLWKLFLTPEFFCKPEGFIYGINEHWETKKKRQEILMSPLINHRIFGYQKGSETQKCFSAECFGIVEQKVFDRKS